MWFRRKKENDVETSKHWKSSNEFIKEDYELIDMDREMTGIYNYSDEYYYNHFFIEKDRF